MLPEDELELELDEELELVEDVEEVEVELELELDDELEDVEDELLLVLLPSLQGPKALHDASLPGTELVYQFAWYKSF